MERDYNFGSHYMIVGFIFITALDFSNKQILLSIAALATVFDENNQHY